MQLINRLKSVFVKEKKLDLESALERLENGLERIKNYSSVNDGSKYRTSFIEDSLIDYGYSLMMHCQKLLTDIYLDSSIEEENVSKLPKKEQKRVEEAINRTKVGHETTDRIIDDYLFLFAGFDGKYRLNRTKRFLPGRTFHDIRVPHGIHTFVIKNDPDLIEGVLCFYKLLFNKYSLPLDMQKML